MSAFSDVGALVCKSFICMDGGYDFASPRTSDSPRLDPFCLILLFAVIDVGPFSFPVVDPNEDVSAVMQSKVFT